MDSERKEPELNLTPPPALAARHARQSGGGWNGLLLVLLIVLQAVAVYALFFRTSARPVGYGAVGAEAPAAPAASEVLKAQALRLEEMGVAAEAARAWERFLDTGAGGSDAERALLRYRIGKLWQEADRFGEALAAYVRAEKEGLKDQATREALGPRVVDCLRALGHYGAIGSELRKRTGSRADDAQSPVVAAYAGETLTRAQFDRILEKEIDAMLAQMEGRMDPASFQQQRERLAGLYRAPRQAAQILERRVLREVMVRRARELKLDREAAFQERLLEVEDLLLAERLGEQEVETGLKPTVSDLEGYLATHQEVYRTPEKARLSVIQVASEEDGKKLLATLKKPEDFAEAARKSSLDEATREQGGKVETPLEKGKPWPGFGSSDELEAAVFAADAGTVLDRPFTLEDRVYLVQVEARMPEAVPALAEVQDRVVQDYVQDKRQELFEALKKQLFDRYQVKIYREALATDGGRASGAAGENSATTGQKPGDADTGKTAPARALPTTAPKNAPRDAPRTADPTRKKNHEERP